MAAFIVSSFGLFVMGLFAGLFTTPSGQTFTVLAYGLGGGQWGAPDDHDLSVADGSHDGEALLVLLCLSGRSAVPGALAVVGADHPLRRAVGARRGTDCARGGRLDQEKGGTADRRGWPLSQRRGLGPPRISHAARAQLCVGTYAGPRAAAGRAGVSVCPSACRSTSKRSKRASCSSRIRPAVPWPAKSWTLSLRNSRRDGFECWAMAAMPPRTTCNSYPPRSTWSRGCSSPASSMPLRPRGPRAGAVRRRKGRCWGPQKPWPANGRLAPPSHRSRGARPSVDRPVACGPARAADSRRGGTPSQAARARTAWPAQASAPG